MTNPKMVYATGVTSAPQSLYSAIGWFNFSSLPATVIVNNTTNFTTTLVNTIKGGSEISARFTLSRTGTAGVNTTFARLAPPTWSGATYGITGYTGITLPTTLKDQTDGASPNYGVITVDNISITTKYGDPISNYNFYFMDSESPQSPPSNEFFTTDGTPWTVFYTLPANGAFPNNTQLLGLGTTIVQTNSTGNMPLLITKNPTKIIQTVTGGGAMSFGLSLTTAEIIKVVSDRIDPSDQFSLSISGSGSGTTITSGQRTGVQAQGLQVISGTGGTFTFNETMAPGSQSPLSLYNQTIQSSNLTAGGTVVPSTISLGQTLDLNFGDYVLVTITNSPAPTVVTLNKSVDKIYCDLSDTITYTLVVNNNSPYPIKNVVLTDTIPTNSTLIPSSITLNGVSISESPSPPTGITIGTIPATSSATITFQVLSTTIVPALNKITNNATVIFSPTISIGSVNSQTVVTTINSGLLIGSKLNDKSIANVGDTITYTISLKNAGNTLVNNIVFIDTIPTGTSFIANSLKQDNTILTGNTSYPGITLPNNILPGITSTITFQVKVNSEQTPNIIPNNASVVYKYIQNPSLPNGIITGLNTNTVTTQVNNVNLSMIKSADKQFPFFNDTITYTIIISNLGNITAKNLIFKDTISNGLIFINNSVFVNGVQQITSNPSNGIALPDMLPGDNTTITFSANVVC